MLGLGMKELEFRDDFPKQFIHAGPCCEGFDKINMSFLIQKIWKSYISDKWNSCSLGEK